MSTITLENEEFDIIDGKPVRKPYKGYIQIGPNINDYKSILLSNASRVFSGLNGITTDVTINNIKNNLNRIKEAVAFIENSLENNTLHK